MTLPIRPHRSSPVGVFIAGTDTAAGKTESAVLLIEALRRAGIAAAGFKPFCCGDRADAERLARASGQISIEEVNPFWYRTPAAPLAAAMIEGRSPDLDLVRRSFAALAARRFLVVEGVGGWLVPVTEHFSMADLAVEFSLPVILVVPNRLGCINHALLSVEAIRSSRARFYGWILNQIDPPDDDPARLTNPALLELLIGLPPLAVIPHCATLLDLPAPLGRLAEKAAACIGFDRV